MRVTPVDHSEEWQWIDRPEESENGEMGTGRVVEVTDEEEVE